MLYSLNFHISYAIGTYLNPQIIRIDRYSLFSNVNVDHTPCHTLLEDTPRRLSKFYSYIVINDGETTGWVAELNLPWKHTRGTI